MRYLGRLRGVGTLKSEDETTSIRTDYDFEGFVGNHGRVTGCGEISLPSAALRKIFGRRDLQLLTEEGRRLTLLFSDKQLPATSDVAHVDVTGGLPEAVDWRN
jgi:hypothetical protein